MSLPNEATLFDALDLQCDIADAEPVFKWPGGKRQLAPQIEGHLPSGVLQAY